jgi:hypothetical protein
MASMVVVVVEQEEKGGCATISAGCRSSSSCPGHLELRDDDNDGGDAPSLLLQGG